jgi:SAM-dependent methyltransferase
MLALANQVNDQKSREMLLTGSSGFSLKTSGFCHCCRKDTTFFSNHEWLRDNYLCTNCGSLPRERHIQRVLDTVFKGWESKLLHESSPSNDLIKQFCGSNYSCSQLPNDQGVQAFEMDCLAENLEFLSFPDETFDLFITKDVLEHVFNPDIAIREIMRVLKKGGAHVFTAPKHKVLKTSNPRAKLVSGEIVYLKEENYHGNPVGDGRALVTWDYGDDFEDLLFSWCGLKTETVLPSIHSFGLDGDYLEVFITRKP